MVAPWASPSGAARVGVDRYEQRRRLVARDPDSVVERDEGVVGPGHDDAIFAGLLDAIAQGEAEGQYETFLVFVARLGSIVDAAMARIDHDDGPRICRRGPRSGGRSGRLPGAAGFRRHRRSRASIQAGFQPPSTARNWHDRPPRIRPPAVAAGRWRHRAHRNWKSVPGPVKSNTIREPPGITRPYGRP